MNKLAQKAISAALNGNWELAENLNKQILKKNSKDIDALNRLARAYIELGKINKAKGTAKKVLEIDPFNTIATKSLNKWKALKKKELVKDTSPTRPEIFLEEPGKTKIVTLLHLGDEKTVTKLDSGDEVIIQPKTHRVSITTKEGKYVGRVPDDIAARIRKLAKMGNKYQTLVKSVLPDEVKVFIREIERAPKLKNVATFSTEKVDYISFIPPELVHKKDSIATTEEED